MSRNRSLNSMCRLLRSRGTARLSSVTPQSGSAEALLPAVRSAVARVDKGQPVARVRTIDVVAAEATSRPRFRAVLVGTFAAVALALAMIGVFGVLAYSVQQRVREFGVRIAMGAAASDVMRLVLGSAAKLTLIGLVDRAYRRRRADSDTSQQCCCMR